MRIMFDDLCAELTRRELPFIKRETLAWMIGWIEESGRHFFTQNDIAPMADAWEHDFLVPAEKWKELK